MSDRRPAMLRATALAVALVAALALAGCSQEGKLIQVPLAVSAVAADFQVPVVGDTVQNARFKITVHVKNACEARFAVLELQRFDPANTASGQFVYQITPIARYSADDKCVQAGLGERDTVITLNVNGLLLRSVVPSPTPAVIEFRVVGAGQDPIAFLVDSLVTVPGPAAVGFEVKVEHALGDSVPGAMTAIDRLDPGGVVTPLDSIAADAHGIARLTIPVTPVSLADSVDVPFLPYRVRVTSGASSRIVSDPTFGARLYRFEKIVVRL